MDESEMPACSWQNCLEGGRTDGDARLDLTDRVSCVCERTPQVTLCPMDGEDMWHVYNIVSLGDHVTATAIRKVVKESATSVQSQRVRLTLTIKVLGIDFDPDDCSVRLSGRNVGENRHVQLGAHHTVELEPHRNFSVQKARWDTIFLERLDTACNPVKQAQVAAVVMQQGLAHVCLITSHMTLVRAKLEKAIPKKRADGKAYKVHVRKFFEMVLQSMAKEIDFALVKVVIIASPGYVKDDFFKYLMEEAGKRPELKPMLRNKGQFMLVHASSGYKHALDEVLVDPGTQAKLLDTQAAKEVKILNKFFRMLNDNSEKAYYSYPHVLAAMEKGAIQSLLVSDALFRASDIKTRKKYVHLVEACRDAGAEVFVFSALHPSGEALGQLSGIAAILRYALPELDDLQVGDEAAGAAGIAGAAGVANDEQPGAYEDDGEGDDLGAVFHETNEHGSGDGQGQDGQGQDGAAAHHEATHDEDDAKAAVDALFQ